MIDNFVYTGLPSRVVFGIGALEQIREEVERLGARRALVLSTPEQDDQARKVGEQLNELCAGTFERARMHVPIEIAEEARQTAGRLEADLALAIGGGSTIGLAKALALDPGLPVLAIPTTYAGSEMTPIWGLTQDGKKTTGRDIRVLPRTVIYDANMVTSLPLEITGASAMNAIAHCVEALYAENANPISSIMAEEGIRALAAHLPKVFDDPENLEARAQGQYGAWLAGSTLGSVGMALHHKLCHVLGGSFDLPHAETHTVILPHAVAYNCQAAEEAIGRVARALGRERPEEAAPALYDLAVSIGAKVALRDIGMKETDLDRAAEIATENPYYNPRAIDFEGIRSLLGDAFAGRRPESG